MTERFVSFVNLVPTFLLFYDAIYVSPSYRQVKLVILACVAQVSKKTVMEIVRRLMTHMDRAEGSFYRDELLHKIIQICSQNNYQYITNFEW